MSKEAYAMACTYSSVYMHTMFVIALYWCQKRRILVSKEAYVMACACPCAYLHTVLVNIRAREYEPVHLEVHVHVQAYIIFISIHTPGSNFRGMGDSKGHSKLINERHTLYFGRIVRDKRRGVRHYGCIVMILQRSEIGSRSGDPPVGLLK